MDLIRDLWHGDIPLWKTYWLFGWLVGMFFYFAFVCIECDKSTLFSTCPGLIIMLVFSLFVLAYTIFIWIAIWRSAHKYQGPRGWAILARVAVIISIIKGIQGFLEGLGIIA